MNLSRLLILTILISQNRMGVWRPKEQTSLYDVTSDYKVGHIPQSNGHKTQP